MSILKIGIIGIAGVLLATQIKQHKAEYGIYICIAISLLIFFQITGYLEQIMDALKEVIEFVEMDHAYIGTILKMLGITYISEFASGICKDAGYQTIAAQIEIFTKVTILVLSMPIMLALLKTIQHFLG